MHSPLAALTWHFWRRHRLGLSVVVAFVATFTVVTAIAPLPANLASVNSMWFIMGLCYVVGVFGYGFDGKLELAESGFPVRLFILPVRTWVLVGWPMLQGVAFAVLLWLAWDRLVLRPSGIVTPLWWSFMLAAIVATSQTLVWLPFGIPGSRLFVMIATLTALVRASAFLALAGEQYTQPETENTILSIFAVVLIPLAFLMAWAGVGRARRGDTPDWLRAWRSAGATAAPSRGARPFPSAMRSQMWYEWRARGRNFVLSIVLFLVAMAAISVATERDDANKTNFSVMFLIVPILIAASWGPVAGTSGTSDIPTRSFRGLSAFAATRPLSNVGFVVAKFRATGVMATAGWVVVLAVLALWLTYTGGHREIGRLWDAAVEKHGIGRVIVVAVLLAVAPVLLTWRTLVVGLWAGLTGRGWVVPVQIILASIVAMLGAYEWVSWQADPSRRERFLTLLPWVAGVGVVFKFILAGWALRVLHDRGDLEANDAVKLLGAWLLVAGGLFALLVWLVPSGLVPRYGLALGVVLLLPLARLLIAPLALAWNRHR